jgi:hypothetical protein
MHNHTYYLRKASEHFLEEYIPHCWDALDPESQLNCIVWNIADRYQHLGPKFILDEMIDLSYLIEQCCLRERRETLEEVKDRISPSEELTGVINAS